MLLHCVVQVFELITCGLIPLSFIVDFVIGMFHKWFVVISRVDM